MPSGSWKGYLSFGLISVPMRLFAAARSSHIAFHEIHKKCGTRVHQQLYCPYDREVVSRDEIGMGYEVAKDKYVLVDPAELKKLEPQSSSVMEILQFVKQSDVDPLYFETSYFAVPDEAGARGYELLVKTMTEMDSAAIAKVTIHLRERTVIVRPYQNGLIVHTLYYPNEIRKVQGFGKGSPASVKKQEMTLAEQFARELVKPFRPEQYHDEYSARVEQLIESKQHGKAAPKAEKGPRLAPVVDLMTALKKSIAERKSERGGKPRKLRKTA